MKVSAMEAMRGLKMDVTVTLTHTRLLLFRLWIGIRLVQLAGWIMGCAISVKTDRIPPQP